MIMLESKLERLRPRGLIRINNRTSSWFVDLLVNGNPLIVAAPLPPDKEDHLISKLIVTTLPILV